MTVDPWWTADIGERYWIEVSDDPSPGQNLECPQRTRSGRPHWAYDFLPLVRAGDVVLHWWTIHHAAPVLLGSSTASAAAESTTVTRRSRWGEPEQVEGWHLPLAGFRRLPEVVRPEALREFTAELQDLKRRLAEAHGQTIYFPFVFSERPMRLSQGYILKLPADALAVAPPLDQAARLQS